ncbi:asparagine synthase B [Candidatus Formimonas warabiya]|uniref:asparagine synthase (glutamine-hydrolyzing) n=1 Tax=Formimonas warabiya TaxID=1761012 RepID=A0A3G1KPP4_FORW1|nr:asparagine synthase B [Candidatus Formimonas warabiya]ATW24439.1 asparagine synthase (glutamine-hydrolyzing) [Candidatus Formimonas warabiya]
MCGIAGVFGSRCKKEKMDVMLNKIRHRGPDDFGTFACQEASFIHARLSIIDVDGGKQPIFNESGTVCIIFNGEIYNHEKLRQMLKEEHNFSTNTDTEAILHLYEEIGENCVSLLDGMFAFAIYDVEKGLLLARDPLGIKPLYISEWQGNVFFASEMKAFLGIVPHFKEFPAGTYYQSGIGYCKFFSLPGETGFENTVEQTVEGIRHYLKEAVKKRLMSDVPLGVFLSGGLDSSIIAALAAEEIPDLNTFAVGMKGSEDLKYARICAEYLGTKHHEYSYTLDDMLEALPDVIYYLESYDAALVRSAIPNYFLSRLASEHVKVVLSGEGADEIFSGYHYLKKFSQEELFKELVQITGALHNTNLQRCDRMSMAHGLEARVPFLDVNLVRYAFSIPISMKTDPDRQEKWILREAFSRMLPDEIVFRRKSKFSEGAGSFRSLAQIAEETISDAEFVRSAVIPGRRKLRNKEELMYYRIFHKFYPAESVEKAIGFSRSL